MDIKYIYSVLATTEYTTKSEAVHSLIHTHYSNIRPFIHGSPNHPFQKNKFVFVVENIWLNQQKTIEQF